jgi:putative transposase
MAHTYTSLLTHVVFATHERKPLLVQDVRPRVHEYLGGIARALKAKPLIVNGIDDHAHMLIEIPPTLSVAEVMKKIKGSSSKWISEEFSRLFDWQRGYGAFAVSRSNADTVFRYIENQEEHHKKVTYEEELKALLEKHGVPFNPKYLHT